MADLSAVLNLSVMTEVLRNFSAPCLNQPVKTFSLGWARSSVTTLLCWNMTCKYQTLPLVTIQTLPTYVQIHQENVSPCHSMFSVGCCSWPNLSPPHLTYLYAGLDLLRQAESCQPDFFFFWPLPMPLQCLRKTNERLHPDVGVKLHSWVNSHCLLYSMACLKWHAGLKRRRPAEF